MPELLDENDANLLVQHEDGEVELVPISPLNRLLFEHDLWGLLRRGDDILVFPEEGERPQVTLIPDEDAAAYTIKVDDWEPLHLGVHMKSRLVDCLFAIYKDGEGGTDPMPLIELYDEVRASRVRRIVTDTMADQPPFADSVETKPDGWLIRGRLLLTYEREFFHPNTTSKAVRGSSVAPGSSENAYQMRLTTPRSDGPRELSIDGQTYRLTDAEMEFVARALWGLAATPELA